MPQPGQVNLSAAQLQAKVTTLKSRQHRYQQMQTQLATSGETQLSLTEPDSRSMPIAQGTDVADNVQLAVDGKHKLIVSADVTNEVTDQAQLAVMAIAAQETLPAESLTLLAR